MIIGAGIVGFPAVIIPKSHAAWARQTIVHPHVDNLRVVAITDAAMTKAVEPRVNWARQNGLEAGYEGDQSNADGFRV